jgi:non-specific serine/threonine protein kinase/serine/threonine-protein kinase
MEVSQGVASPGIERETDMTPERWNEVKAIFDRVVQCDPASRPKLLCDCCRDDEALRREVESLLECDQPTGSLGDVFGDRTPAVPGSELTVPVTNDSFGPYVPVRVLGEGGMGTVYLARQEHPIRREVALKLVKPGLDGRHVIERFNLERQALAIMDHPNVARVLDAGTSAQGHPYFVMEYVAGVPITAYWDNHRLNTRERLELFMRVCEGVQHAHQKAIIHRDLKPSNILVTEEADGRASPRIIDFGVAKALTKRLTADTMFTIAGVAVGTPAYMSPEQADTSIADIDTRSDIYSLGVILYELLVGAPPLDLREITFEEFLRRLREEEPLKPSTRIRTQDPDTSSGVARTRETESRALANQMRGDLDSITLKALEKDRSRRYGSAADLAADVGRYLNDEAVLAVPPSAVYRIRKFGRRHRAVLATTAAFILVLLLASGVSIWEGIRANREAAVAQAVNNFLQKDLLEQASTAIQLGLRVKPDRDLTVRTALDRAAARITGKFDSAPEVEAAIRETIGHTYMNLGLYPEARTQLERALDLYRRVLGTRNRHSLNTMTTLGNTASHQARYSEAEALFSQALGIQRRILGPKHPDTLYSMNSLANVYRWQGKLPQSERPVSCGARCSPQK